MELKEFIKTTLLDISAGVESANKESNRFLLGGQQHFGKSIYGEYVEFDVAVVAEEKKFR